jgi:hypothetical protein
MTNDRTESAEQESKAKRAEAVERQLSGEEPRTDPPKNDPEPPEEARGASSVGESTTRRAEDIAAEKEPGRQDTGTEGKANRPTGTSTARDATGVDPQEPVTDTPMA